MSSISSRVALLLLFGVTPTAQAEIRTWTDKQGQTTKAEFVRVFEGRVVLKAGTQTLQVPVSQLSQQDQDYVASKLNKKGRGKDEGDSLPIRFWTDAKGNQTAASFVRMNGTQVVLSESGRPRPIDFAELSEADREHIKGLLREQGQEATIESLDRHVEAVAKAAAARQAARESAPSPPPDNNPFERMRQQQEAAAEQARQREEQRRQEEEQRRQEFEQRQAADRERRQQQAEEYKRQQEERNQQLQQQLEESRQRSQESMQQMQERMAAATSTTTITEYRCSKCNKVVPDNINAGGHCPHCGVYFEYSESPTGQREYASAGSSDWSNVRVTGRAIKGVVFLVILVGSGVAALWRKFAG